MSEINEFMSDRQEAEQESQKLKDAGLSLSLTDGSVFVRSNLTVVNNLRNVYSELDSCNVSFIELINNNADFIHGLQEIFEMFDADLSTKMER